MRSRPLSRIAAVAIVLGGTAVGTAVATAVTAPSAFALAPGCSGSDMLFYESGVLGPPAEVYGQSYYWWNGCTFHLNNSVTISEYVNGTWVEVAAGQGQAVYQCGDVSNLYKVVEVGSGTTEFDCG